MTCNRFWFPRHLESQLSRFCTVATKTNHKTGKEVLHYPLFIRSDTHIGFSRHTGYAIHRTLHIDYTAEFCDGAPLPENVQFSGQLRPEQLVIVENVRNQLDVIPYTTMIQCPPGFGKTVLTLKCITQYIKRRTLIIVHTSVLLKQWQQRISSFVPHASIGLIQGKRFDCTNKDFIVGTVQTLSRRDLSGLNIGCIVFDEAHHIGAKTFFETLHKVSAKFIIGLSATPQRTDGSAAAIHALFGHSFIRPVMTQTASCIVHLIKFQHARPLLSREANPRENKLIYQTLAYQKLSHNHVRNSKLAKAIGDLFREGHHIIVLSKFTKHLHSLREMCRACPKDQSGVLLAGVQEDARQDIITSKRVIFATFQMAKEGLDIPRLTALVVCLPSGGVQQYSGRILRGPSNQNRVIVEVDDTHLHRCAWIHYMWLSRLRFYRTQRYRIITLASVD